MPDYIKREKEAIMALQMLLQSDLATPVIYQKLRDSISVNGVLTIGDRYLEFDFCAKSQYNRCRIKWFNDHLDRFQLNLTRMRGNTMMKGDIDHCLPNELATMFYQKTGVNIANNYSIIKQARNGQ